MLNFWSLINMLSSSSGLGRWPLTPVTRVRVPSRVPNKNHQCDSANCNYSSLMVFYALKFFTIYIFFINYFFTLKKLLFLSNTKYAQIIETKTIAEIITALKFVKTLSIRYSSAILRNIKKIIESSFLAT